MKKKKKPSMTVPGKPTVQKVKKAKSIKGKTNLRLLSTTPPSKGAYAGGRGKKRIIAITFAGVLLVLILTSAFIIKKYTITSVTVEGNVHYTSDEIIKFVMNGKYDSNSLYLAFKYKNKGIEDIPFIETMDVTILSPNAIKITVYEKAIAGYVEYLGRFMYFDKDGIVVETSDMRTEGIPEVTGLSFNHIVLYEALPVENAEVFTKILNITQLLTKYDIMTDKIFFNKQNEMTLYFGNARVKLGDGSNLDEKIMRLTDILPDLEGKKGVLQMENYSEDTPNITFELDS